MSITVLPTWYSGVLTIYKNHPGGNFRHKHLTITCDAAGEGISIKYIYISQRDLKEQLNSNCNFQFSHVNGKYPRFLMFSNAAPNAMHPGQSWVSNSRNYSSYRHHLGLDVCFDEYHFDDSLPAHLIENTGYLMCRFGNLSANAQ